MKKFLHWLFFIAIAISVSCTTERDDATPNPDPQETSGHKVSAEAALANLNALLPQLDGATRAGGRSVAELRTVHAAQLLPETRGEAAVPDLEELVYIANFSDGEGYAVLAADDRLPGILAIVDEGSLTPAQLVETARGEYDDPSNASVAPGVVQYLLGFGSGKIAPLYIGGDKPPVVTDSTKYPTGTRYVYGEWKQTENRSPMIQTKWDQCGPFDYFVVLDHPKCPVGCNPVATGQLVAHMAKKYDIGLYSVGGRPVDFGRLKRALGFAELDTMRTFSYYDVNIYSMEIANFLYGIGLELKTKYTPDGSPAPVSNTLNYLKKLQYKNVELRTFDSNTISDMIMKWLPVWTVGGPANNEHATHAWLIDGLCKQTRTVEQYSGLIFVAKYNQSRTLYHCNFGWGGRCDGYYATEVFDVADGPIFYDKYYGDKGYTENFDFSYDKQFIYYTSAY